MTSAPIILVPGFWLGAWAWDEVAAALRADGHDVTALTLPGLESVDADRSAITLSDHVDAICEAVRAAGAPVVLAVHSGDRVLRLRSERPGPRADRGDGLRRLRPRRRRRWIPTSTGSRSRCPRWTSSGRRRTSTGSREEQIETFRRRAVPEPGGVLREAIELTNDARLDVPEHGHLHGVPVRPDQGRREGGTTRGSPGLTELRDVTWVDLPTSHWPMWSRPQELAVIIGDVAKAHAPDA